MNRPTTHHLTHPYPAPEIELRDLKGNQVHLSEFRGKAVVLNFWATWCAPCRRELPWFIEFQEEYGPRGLQVIGVSMDDEGINAIALFARRMGIDFVVLLGQHQLPNSFGDSRVSSLYGGLAVLPTTYYISPHGDVIAFVDGVLRKTEGEHDIREVLASGVRK